MRAHPHPPAQGNQLAKTGTVPAQGRSLSERHVAPRRVGPAPAAGRSGRRGDQRPAGRTQGPAATLASLDVPGICVQVANNWRLAQRNFKEALEHIPQNEESQRKEVMFHSPMATPSQRTRPGHRDRHRTREPRFQLPRNRPIARSVAGKAPSGVASLQTGLAPFAGFWQDAAVRSLTHGWGSVSMRPARTQLLTPPPAFLGRLRWPVTRRAARCWPSIVRGALPQLVVAVLAIASYVLAATTLHAVAAGAHLPAAQMKPARLGRQVIRATRHSNHREPARSLRRLRLVPRRMPGYP